MGRLKPCEAGSRGGVLINSNNPITNRFENINVTINIHLPNPDKKTDKWAKFFRGITLTSFLLKVTELL